MLSPKTVVGFACRFQGLTTNVERLRRQIWVFWYTGCAFGYEPNYFASLSRSSFVAASMVFHCSGAGDIVSCPPPE